MKIVTLLKCVIKKRKLRVVFAKRLLSYCVQCVLLLLRFFFQTFEERKVYKYGSISKKDSVKGKILNFIFSLYTLSNNMCAISKNIFSIIQLNKFEEMLYTMFIAFYLFFLFRDNQI